MDQARVYIYWAVLWNIYGAGIFLIISWKKQDTRDFDYPDFLSPMYQVKIVAHKIFTVSLIY